MHRWFRRLVVVACLALLGALAVGCAASAAQDPARLKGPVWQVATYRSAAGEMVETLQGQRMTITFNDDGTVNGTGGVNTFNGSYAVDGDRLTFGPLAATMMAGPPAFMDGESAYFGALEKTRAYRVDDAKLELLDEGGDVLVTYKEAEPVSLEGAPWNCVSYDDGSGSLFSVIPTAPITAEFSGGQIKGSTSVNTYSGAYFSEGGNLTIPPGLAVTKKAGDPEAMAQEAAYLAALPRAATYTITDDVLAILDAEGTRVAVFRPSVAQ